MKEMQEKKKERKIPAQPAQWMRSRRKRALIRAMKMGVIVMIKDVAEAVVRLNPLIKRS